MNLSDFRAWFLENCTPFEGKYALKDGMNWKMVKAPMTDKVLDRGLSGIEPVGYYCRSMLDYFIIDIDDHDSSPVWSGWNSSPILAAKLDDVLGCIGVAPSFLIRTPRGIHGYWFLDKEVPSLILRQAVEEKVSALAVEVYPRMKTPIRVPRKDSFLVHLPWSGSTFPQPVKSYRTIDIFGHSFTPADLRREREQRSKHIAAKTARDENWLENAEAMYGEFLNGETNDAFCSLVTVYYSCGLSQIEAEARIGMLARRSPGYTGGLLNPSERHRRIASSYSNLDRIGIQPRFGTGLSLDPDLQAWVSGVKDDRRWSSRQKKPLRQFLIRFVLWNQYVRETFLDVERRTAWNYQYPFFIFHMKNGYVPLPSGMLKRWSHRYKEIMGYLEANGYLSESPHGYSTGAGYSKHYRVSIGRQKSSTHYLQMTGTLSIERKE